MSGSSLDFDDSANQRRRAVARIVALAANTPRWYRPATRSSSWRANSGATLASASSWRGWGPTCTRYLPQLGHVSPQRGTAAGAARAGPPPQRPAVDYGAVALQRGPICPGDRRAGRRGSGPVRPCSARLPPHAGRDGERRPAAQPRWVRSFRARLSWPPALSSP